MGTISEKKEKKKTGSEPQQEEATLIPSLQTSSGQRAAVHSGLSPARDPLPSFSDSSSETLTPGVGGWGGLLRLNLEQDGVPKCTRVSEDGAADVT